MSRKSSKRDPGKPPAPPEVAPGKPAGRFRLCPCCETFDMTNPAEVEIHVPHITAAEMQRSSH
jgi:hypothetical protein